ncbi:SAM-dependent methyltransferase [Lentzea sp. BCCO 10_0856]|uniref:S-adenosyl-L-methionine-dependent methyltransferase n=1 Tax=Lentzea miocenica TaxID=3095431 RepID=A0ABU4TH76_9PSEU|nr:SAM-dependent methyltransferase [Lentzea sp. BCCO 10_0856]MDX8037549.1 SAM-dependent methyltransferase [Lentzea sp. BCCO 10_0856]
MQAVSRTALWVASMRAAEAARPDRLHDDPLAAAVVAAAESIPAAPPGAAEFMAVRTRFYDDFLLSSGATQVVVLAAGLDARAFRLSWPSGVRLFELDLPELLDFKERLVTDTGLTTTCSRVVVPVDLRTDWTTALTAAGFSASSPTAWIAEGLLQYLTEADRRRLLDTISALSVPGSRFAFDHMDTSADDRESVVDTLARIRDMGAEFVATVDDPALWLAAHGWAVTTDRVPALAVTYGRPLPDFMDPAAANATALCTATLPLAGQPLR